MENLDLMRLLVIGIFIICILKQRVSPELELYDQLVLLCEIFP